MTVDGLSSNVTLLAFSTFPTVVYLPLTIAMLRAEKEWGDGIRGLALSAARFSLLR